jgi:Skp family chaperone for outer membrane proteins
VRSIRLPIPAGLSRTGILAASLLAGAAMFVPPPEGARAQSNPDYFIPNQPQQRPPAQRPAPQAQPAQRPAQPARPPVQVSPNPQDDAQQPPAQVQLPPPPDIPALPRGTSPPAAVIGVLGVPEIMRASTAAQQVERIIGERREKLNEDAQKEQASWRDLQQSLANERSKLSADQIRNRERELQDRITKAQREFRDRGNIIQQAAQYGLAQIERTLVAVIQRVAESRSMNLVLHRQQVALNVNEFDITEAVVENLNKVLPSVVIPPDGVAPPTIAQAPAAPAPAPAAAPAQWK